MFYFFFFLAGLNFLRELFSLLAVVISYLTWHTFVPLLAQICLTMHTTCEGGRGIWKYKLMARKANTFPNIS